MADNRINDLARAILNRSITPDDVPAYDRDSVQEVILGWYLEQRPPRKRYATVHALRTARVV